MNISFNIRKLIAKYDYITIDQLMREVSSINESSYYRKKKTIGEQGDFITAPEISQLFGEVIGLWCITQWQSMQCPNKVTIVELGPGRGLLMRDLIKTVKQLAPEFYQSISIQLLEINQNFINDQKTNLSVFDINIDWISDITNINNGPVIIIANEFFDALPIKQYIKVKNLWYESIVTIDPIDSKFKFDKIQLQCNLQSQLLDEHINAHDGAILEESLESLAIIRFISNHIKTFTGRCLIVDYGYDIPAYNRTRYHYNSTLQSIKDHRYNPVFENLGIADLSAHVDFNALKKTAQEHKVHTDTVISQAEFLVQNGILIRAKQLESDIVSTQANYLIGEEDMGNLFKVLVLKS